MGAEMDEPPLADRLLQTGKLAFDPAQPEEIRLENQPRFEAIIDGYINRQYIV